MIPVPDQPNRFQCPECGPSVRVDEDGCCRMCGSDTTPVYVPPNPSSPSSVERLRPLIEQWQDISTAPKGEPLLVALIQDGKVMRVSDAMRSDLGFYTVYGGTACHWRTHWMPLPSAPSSAIPETKD